MNEQNLRMAEISHLIDAKRNCIKGMEAQIAYASGPVEEKILDQIDAVKEQIKHLLQEHASMY